MILFFLWATMMETGKNNIYAIQINDKRYILGRRNKAETGTLHIGQFYALDGSSGASVEMDATFPHAILICGKRGYGKSYTMGVLIEEISFLEEEIRNDLSVIIIDTLGIFWTMAYPNSITENNKAIKETFSKGIDISLYVPKKSIECYGDLQTNVIPFQMKTSDITSEHWCTLFNVKPTDPFGMILTKAVLHLQEETTSYTIQDIIDTIHKDTSSNDRINGVAENFFTMAKGWDIFGSHDDILQYLIQPGKISVLDISHISNMQVKQVLLHIISEKLFQYRVQVRKKQEKRSMGLINEEHNEPMIWLAIDEAQLFLPVEENNIAKNVLIEKWLRQGRQPGLSLVMATQRPSAIDQEVLSHCDIIFCHRLTAQDDILSLQKLRPTYMKGSIEGIMKKIGREKGVCLVIDDTMEESHIIKIRPRRSWHGGGEPSAGSTKKP